MKQEALSTTNRPSLDEVKEQFQHWRKTRKKSATIPKPLWQAAIELSRDYTENLINTNMIQSFIANKFQYQHG